MNKLNLKCKFFKMIFFYIKTNIKFFAFFLISITAIVTLLFVYVCKKGDISLSEFRNSTTTPPTITYFFNFGITGFPMIFIFILISLFFITKIFSSETQKGRISFWLSNSDRATTFWSKFTFIQIVTITLFLPVLIVCSIYGRKIVDIWNYDLIIKQLFIFLLMVITLNTLFILLNNVFTYKIFLFWLISGLFLFVVGVTTLTSEIYFMDRDDWKFFQYNQYLSILLVYPNLLHMDPIIQQDSNIYQGILEVSKKELFIKLLGVQVPLIFAQSFISNIIFIKRDFVRL